MSPYYAYCDESGNTGSNLYDPNQPVLTFGGWLFPSKIVNELSVLTADFLKQTRPESREFHGADLLKSASGRIAIVDLIYNLCRLPCLPLCVVAEKRYMIATKMVELFLAPESNPYIPDSFDFSPDARRRVADAMCNLSDNTLMQVTQAFRSLDRGQLLGAIQSVSIGLSLRNKTRLADLVKGSIPYVDRIIEENSAGRAMFPKNVMATPNVSAFVAFFSFIEELGRMSGMEDIVVIFDDSAQYSKAFEQIFWEVKEGKYPLVTRNPESEEPVYFGLQVLSEFRTAVSSDEPLIQTADILNTVVCRYATDICMGRQSSPEVRFALELTMPIIEGVRREHRLVGSPQFVERFFRSLSDTELCEASETKTADDLEWIRASE